ncbi:hypothetical protein EDB19DRAFT_1768252 [Suillus lakei]|nr:hypothetical protein EDB19DRAFT_1768252 [Suillus lakei]
MRFASLATTIICAAAMAGVAIASDNLVISSATLDHMLISTYEVGCAKDTKLNNGNDFGYHCGKSGTIVTWTTCSCKNCCHVKGGTGYSCGPEL